MIRPSRHVTFLAVAAVSVATCLFACSGGNAGRKPGKSDSLPADSARLKNILHEDSLAVARADSATRYSSLTDADFKLVADELGIEIAAMKAVVVVEAGSEMKGFAAPGVPIVNFDASMWKIYGSKGSGKGDPNAKVPEGLSGYSLKEWTQLVNARKKNVDGADMSTFWGMFQIGGFNYKLCGCESVAEFVEKMSYSELEQLELFGIFLKNSGMLADIRKKNWASFARKYNGPNYARRGYHTKMAAAYKKFSSSGSR